MKIRKPAPPASRGQRAPIERAAYLMLLRGKLTSAEFVRVLTRGSKR